MNYDTNNGQSDYYKCTTKTIANSNTFAPEADGAMFPTGGVYIGELERATHRRLPALIPFGSTGGVCFLANERTRNEVNKAVQNLALRIVASLPSKMCRLALYDGMEDDGSLIALSNLSDQMDGGKILIQPNELTHALQELQTHIPHVVQKVFDYEYADKSLVEYNAIVG